MKTGSKALIVVLMLVAVAMSPLFNVCGQAAPPAELLVIKDYGENVDDDTLFEWLVFSFNLSINQSGKYTVSGTLLFQGQVIVPGSATKNLVKGFDSIELKFNSSLIFKNGKDGPFTVDFYIKFENNLPFNETRYTTLTTYRYRDFDDPDNWPVTPERFLPKAYKEQDRIVLRNDLMTVWFYYRQAKFVWFYTKDNKSMTRFHLEYTKVHGFPWHGSEWFRTELAAYTGDINDERRGAVSESGPSSGRNKNYGEYVTYSVTYSDVPIVYLSSGNTMFHMNLTISVLLAAGDRNINLASEQGPVLGGTQLKIDFDIRFNSPIGVNGIALEHEIWSESSKAYHHDYQLMDAGRTLIERENIDDSENRFETSFREPQRIEFSPKYSKPVMAEGQYFWFSMAYVDGASSLAPMTYAYSPETKHLKLYLSFVTGGLSISSVQADPGIGVLDGSCPCDKNFIPPEGPAPPSILVTFAGWLSAICLVILPLWLDFRRQRRKLREIEEEFGEEL